MKKMAWMGIRPLTRSALLAVVMLSGALACSRPVVFRPALVEQSVSGHPETAATETAGVRVTAKAGGWSGWPSNLEDRLTPVEVTLENHSGRELRLQPSEFGLVADNGFRYAPLSSSDVLHTAAALVGNRYGGIAWSLGYYNGPYWPWYGPGFTWGFYSYPYYPYDPWAGLPPSSQLLEAPPQGQLQNGGHITAHLFYPVPARNLPQFELVVDLIDNATGDPIGTVRIPLVSET